MEEGEGGYSEESFGSPRELEEVDEKELVDRMLFDGLVFGLVVVVVVVVVVVEAEEEAVAGLVEYGSSYLSFVGRAT